MNLSAPPDVSLYELAISSQPQPQPLQISPTTFKSLIGIVIDLLIEQQIPATLWLKLPKGEVWQAELERFYQSATAPYTAHCLQTHQEGAFNTTLHRANSTQGNRLSSDQLSSDRLSSDRLSKKYGAGEAESWNEIEPGPSRRIRQGVMLDDLQEMTLKGAIDAPLSNAQAPGKVHILPLSPDSQLKREYFLLVASPELCGLVLAHRPRSVYPRSEATTSELPLPTGTKQSLAVEESLEQKHPLLGICSFEHTLLQQVAEGVNRAICFGQPATQSNVDIEALLVDWNQLMPTQSPPSLNATLMGRLLTKQVQRQEEIWRSGSVYRRQAEQAATLRQENEELLAAAQFKDEFIKTMGQELRTPLATMKTALSLLNSPHLKPPQRQRYLDMISRECDRQSSLISSVLDLVQLESSVEQMPMEPLRLTDIVPGVVSTYQPLAQEKGLMLGYNIPEELPPVSCVNHWLKQIVINLLHNSIKFTPSGGQVWVRAKIQDNCVQMEFRDTGVGIAQSNLPKIFDRFYRIRGSGDDSSGAGLGLSIVQQLLLRSGGSISVKSKPGEGSIFNVLLPIYHEEAEAKAADRPAASRETNRETNRETSPKNTGLNPAI
jgi:signal transduction histidine kinase